MKSKMQSNLQDKNLCLQMLRTDGFFTFHNDAVLGTNIERFKGMCTDLSYKRGGSFKTDRVSDFSLEDRSIFASEFMVSLFGEFKAKLQDVFVTHEYKTGTKARNNFLHFDRLRSLKENEKTDYTNLKKISEEVKAARKTFKKYKWPVIDVTRKSVEETAASIIKIHEINSRNE